MKSRNPYQSGSALIIILPIIAILTLIILTVLSMALFDSHLASNTFEQARAGSIVEYAIDDVSDKLYQIPLDRHWASGPGRIRYWDGVSSWSNIDLHSGAPAATPAAAADYLDGVTAATAAKCVQLNVPLADGSYTIMSTNSEYGTTAPDMTIKWIYVLQDGTIQTNPALLPNQGVVGRYGYWTDVENGRVNINTAGLGMVNRPGANDSGRFTWALENWVTGLGDHNWGDPADLPNYIANVLTPNPWATDHVQVSASGVNFQNLNQLTTQQNTIQNLTAHPSSIDLSFLDGVSAAQSFNTFRYAGSYFLRVDALNAYFYFQGGRLPSFGNPPTPDMGVRFFDDPKDWNLIVGSDPTIYQRNKGYITTKGRSPEINPWGLNKIPLSLVPSDGHALNDLTEFYSRTVATSFPNSEDSRHTQVPALGTYDGGGASQGAAPPWSPMAGRSNFRDLASAVPFYASGGGDNYRFVATLMNDLTTTLNLTAPGFANSLGAKYNSQTPASPGEAEQFSTQLMTFVNSCIDPGSNGAGNPGIAYYCSQSSLNPYGLGLPLTAKVPGVPYTPVRREGTNGEFLLNEIALEAQPVSYSQFPGFYPSNPPSVATGLPNPKAYSLTLYSSVMDSIFFFLREPTDNSPPNGTSTDKFIKVILHAEVMNPARFGLMPSFPRATIPQGGLGNTVLQWSTDDITWHTLNYDIWGDQKVNGVYTPNADYVSSPPVWISDNPTPYGSYGQPNTGTVYPFGAISVRSSVPVNSPPQDSYVQTSEYTPECIYIGPFPQGTVVSFKIKTRVYIPDPYSGTLFDIIPGIFPDFPSGSPGDASYKSGADPNDPVNPNDFNNPASAAAQVANNFLEFDFTDMNLASPASQMVDYEATDPRVNKHSTDWKLCTDPSGDTFGRPNSMFSTGLPPGSDLVRPPAFLQYARGFVRYWCLYFNGGGNGEIQTAARILGLPGVGHLAGLSTGADSGIPWSSVKFEAGSATSPPDWLLWNLFYVPFDRSMTNETDGKLNINAKLYPFKDVNGNDLIREKPLEALLGNRVSNPSTLAHAIAAGPTYTNGGSLPSDLYVYAGQICEVPGFADASAGGNDYDMERLPRDLADIVTTQSSDFRVFIVAQTLKQTPGGQIVPVSTQRIETTLSRVVDAGTPDYPFGIKDGGGYPINVYRRDAYRPLASGPPVPSAARFDVRTLLYNVSSDLGADHIPNTGDDWIIPRQIEISSYKIIK